MKTGLVVFGIIFLVLGALLYLVPGQEFRANTTSVGDGNVDTRTSSASVVIPVQWAYAIGIIGLLLFVIGLIAPGSQVVVKEVAKEGTYDVRTSTKENIEVGRGKKRKIIRERTERRKVR
jgi:hypothetical protein